MRRTEPISTVGPAHQPAALASAQATVAEICARWSSGETPDAAAALADHPQLRDHKSLVLDLAYEEYCRRVDAGESVPLDEFVARFSHPASLRRLLLIHDYYEGHPALAPSAGPVWPKPGEEFLGLKLIELLGRGAFARVFLAREPALGDRQVAVKITSHGAAEARTLGQLQHPHIVPVWSVRSDPQTGLTALVMPYLGRSTLCDLLDQRPAGRDLAYINRVLEIGAALADALAFTHAQQVLHRDLKPSNVLLGDDGRAMLLDFNLAARIAAPVSGGAGTLPYMAPEQLAEMLHEKAPVDVRSDVFGLGVVLYELFTGELPFRPQNAEAPAAQLASRKESLAPIAARLTAATNRDICRLVMSCLAADPAARPQTAEVVAAELKRQQAWAPRAGRWIAAHPRRTAGALCVAGVLVAAAALVIPAATIDPLPKTPVIEPTPLAKAAERLQQGDLDGAASELDLALQSRRDAGTLFARGYVQFKRGANNAALLDEAMHNLLEAYKLTEDPRVEAYLGLCASRIPMHQIAINSYVRAQRDGFKPPELWANLGYSYLQSNRPADAKIYLDKAIAANGRLQAAYANRALLELKRAQQEGKAPTPGGLSDIERAIELGPERAELYRDAALLFALSARYSDHAAHKQRALAFAEKAVALGWPGASLHPKQEPALTLLEDEPRFQQLCKPSKSAPAAVRFERTIDPLGGDALSIVPSLREKTSPVPSARN